MNSLVKESDAALVQSVNLELTVLMPCLNVAETPLSRAPTRPSLSRNTGSVTVLLTTDRLALAHALLVAAGAAMFGFALYAWALRGFGRLPDPLS